MGFRVVGFRISCVGPSQAQVLSEWVFKTILAAAHTGRYRNR